MINTYSSSSPNPCGFCSNDLTEIPIGKKEDYIRVDLDGNDTTLFIRETSVEDVATIQDETAKPVEEDIAEMLSSSMGICSPFSEDCRQTSARTDKTVEDLIPVDDKTARYKQFDQLYFKKWSGKTYFEEELRKIRIQEYQRDLEEAMKKRNLWKAFQKEIARERRRDLIKTSGPEWWQEPSRKQICLATSLGDVITADYEEGVTGRTRQWLLDLGVTTRLTSKQVRKCMKNSLLDPIDFLLETHSVVLKSQLHVKKKRGDLERPFSINERLLLSAVCVLHLPTLLTMLHYILPPPKPYSTEKHIQELLFGNLDDERVRYSSPYMEPIPFRNEAHFLNWAVDKVFRALLPSMVQSEIIDEYKGGSLSLAIPSMNASVMNQKAPSVDDKKRATYRFSDYSNTRDSVTWLITECIAKRQITASLYPFREGEDGAAKNYRRQLLAKRSISKQTSQLSRDETIDENMDEVSVSTSVNTIASGQEVPTGASQKNVLNFAETLSFINDKSRFEPESRNPSSETTKSAEIDNVEESLSTKTHSQDLLSKHSQNRSSIETTQVLSLSINKDGVSERVKGKRFSAEESVELKHSELQKLWDEIAALPKNKQLQHALEVLRGMGDPLARLPKVHTIPTVLRWLELRQGKNRILSKSAKEELLRRSRGMWKMAPIGSGMEGPKVHCSKRVERQLTWNKRQWLGTQVNKAVKKYYTTVRQEKVDNARTFFPTMLNHYDHGSKLNRDFRDVFFTYLPAREADTFVYRPWQPQESK